MKKNDFLFSRIIVSVILLIAATLLLWSFDYYSKRYIYDNFIYGESVRIAGDFVRITYVRNYLNAFSFFDRDSWYSLPIAVFIIGTLLSVLVYYFASVAEFIKTTAPPVYNFFGKLKNSVKLPLPEEEKTGGEPAEHAISMHKIYFPLILAGAFGNVLDRFTYGYVIDFIDVGAPFYRWPVFNLADAYVFVPMILFVIFHIHEIHLLEGAKKKDENGTGTEKQNGPGGLVSVQITLIVLCIALAGIGYGASHYEELIRIYIRWFNLTAVIVAALLIFYYYIKIEIYNSMINDQCSMFNEDRNSEH
ncbi:MAG: hypothetical protein GY862_38280 [Gammaproteobacteria bacterium]|nr:hypothetical protein [Gammaproteobacteria bacterium]